MVKSLNERLIAAKKPRARLTDNESLLADLKQEFERTSTARDTAAGESIDFALSEDDRETSACNAARCERTAKALCAEIAELESIIEEHRNSEARQKVEAERSAAISERDILAKRFAVRVPDLVKEFISLMIEVKANEQRLIASGAKALNAEFEARGIPGSGYMGPTPVPTFASMKIPQFSGSGRVWPVSESEWVALKSKLQVHIPAETIQ